METNRMILHVEFSESERLASGPGSEKHTHRLWLTPRGQPGMYQEAHWANIKMKARISMASSTSRAGI